MAGNSRFDVRIGSTDVSGPGWASAEKRAQKFATAEQKRLKEAAKANSVAAKAKGLSNQGGGLSSWQSPIGGAMRGVASVGSGLAGAGAWGLKSSFSVANAAAGGLASGLSSVVSTGGQALGMVGAFGVAAAKMASSAAEGGTSIARLSASIGVGTRALQEWQGAAERFGVDKDATSAGLGSIASTLHEAKYGRDNQALAAMNQLGITPKYGADGAADVGDFSLKLADVIKRQTDPMTQAKIASIFGVSGMLPALRQGSSALQANGAHVWKYGGVRDDAAIADDQRLYYKGVVARQIGDRMVYSDAQGAAVKGEGLLDKAIHLGEMGVDMHDGRNGSTSLAGHVVDLGHALANEAIPAVNSFSAALNRWTGINLGSIGGRLNNLGNVRPVGGGGFRRFDTPGEGVMAMGRQIVRDQDVHGAQTLYDLYAGTMGPDGRRHWGYAPQGDHNDPAAYARLVGSRAGIGPGRFNAHDPQQLAAIMSASIAHETGSKLSPAQIMPYAQRIVLEVHGLPAGTKVAAKSDRGGVAIAHAMAGTGP